MIIDNNTVENIAQLARLELSEQQREKMLGELNSVLEWMNKLNEIDTENIDPLIHMSYEINVLRNDEVKEDISHNAALINAPKKDSNYFRVPKVID